MNHTTKLLIVILCLSIAGIGFAGDDYLKPYFLASTESGTITDKLDGVKLKLSEQGFEIVGEYQPYPEAHIIIVTSDELNQNAAQSEFGGYGAAQRISLTEVNGQVQIAYTNPTYMANAYRMKDELTVVKQKLSTALGETHPFGSEEGLTVKKLRKYRYMMMMPYFDDQDLLAEYDSHQSAIEAVEQGLSQGKGGTAKVYRIDIPGKEEVLFGVAITSGKGGDKTVMNVVDASDLKATPHLPYEILVSGNSAYALHGKFRIALSFPDLGMGTFMKISGAPKGIKQALQQASGGK